MTPTRRFWAIIFLWIFFAGYAVVQSSPIAVVGISALSAWLIVTQARLVRELTRTDELLTITSTLSQSQAAIDQDVRLILQAELERPADTEITITAGLPLTATTTEDSERTLHLEPGETTVETTVTFRIPVAGRFTLPAPRVQYVDSQHLVTESVTRGESSTLLVEPRSPRAFHIGQGGDRFATAYGEHPTGQSGSGLLPAELRQYVPGDTADQIDWKATARLNSAYVREFEAETDRQTVLFCDHRSSMGTGPAGQTMLDYTREIALKFCNSAERLSDPLGLYTIGETGLTTRREPSAAPETYESIRTRLLMLSPTDQADSSSNEPGAAPVRVSQAQSAARQLTGETSNFATRLRPYLTASQAYVQRLEGDPLFEAMRRHRYRRAETTWTILLTNDRYRNQLRETISVANDDGDHVLVFLTPYVLFEQDALSSLQEAYERYLAFEEFRRELDRLPRVTVFEVGPGDRLEAILTSRQTGRTTSPQ